MHNISVRVDEWIHNLQWDTAHFLLKSTCQVGLIDFVEAATHKMFSQYLSENLPQGYPLDHERVLEEYEKSRD